jgi:sugar transferase (PEP-CTERM/EpsH1 system associated)
MATSDELRPEGGDPPMKVLMVCHRVPHPPDKGERIRGWHMLRELARHFDVYLAAPVDRPLSFSSWRALSQLTRDMALYPLSSVGRAFHVAGDLVQARALSPAMFRQPTLAAAIHRWHREEMFDAALAVCSTAAPYIMDLPIRQRLVDLVDVDSAKWEQYADQTIGLKRLIYRWEANRLGAYEHWLAGVADGVLLTTEAEAALYRRRVGAAPVTVIPNGVDLEYFTVDGEPDEQPTVVFTGVLNYRPNVQGIAWFVEHVWPLVRQQVADAQLRIVGMGAGRAVHALGQNPGVRVVGAVDDVRPEVTRAAVSVAPLHVARGIQNKILEAMAMARAVVATHDAATGINCRFGEHLLVADQADRFAGSVVRLLKDRSEQERIGQAARRYVEHHHCWDQCLSPLVEVMQRGRQGDSASFSQAA